MSETSKKKTLSERASSNPTELHERFAKWIEEQTGVKPDLKTVQLAVSFRMDFQRSDNNQSSLAERKAEAAKKEAERIAKRKAALEKELAKLSSAVEAPVKTVKVVTNEEAAASDPEVVAGAQAATETAPTEEAEVDGGTTETATTPKPRARRSRRTAASEPVK